MTGKSREPQKLVNDAGRNDQILARLGQSTQGMERPDSL
jgi:hypothetical protein